MTSQPQNLSNFDSKTTLNKINQKELNTLIQALADNPSTYQFRSPVQWEKYGLLNYLQIVKRPMDLLTVRLNLKKGVYKCVQECLDDIQLIWENSKLYNYGNNWIYELTLKCQAIYHKMIKNYFAELVFKEKKKIYKKKNIEKQDQLETKALNDNNCGQKQTIMQQKESCQGLSNQKQTDILRQKFLGRVTKCSYQQVSIIYLMVKNNCLKAIKYDDEGNCCIDAQMLDQKLLTKIFQFLDSPKQSKTPKKKVKQNENSCKKQKNQ